nr:tyrosine--tRNA ligase [Chloroflexia bacterium]
RLTWVQGEALREAKQVLAFEATALAHGISAAEAAREGARALFSRHREVNADAMVEDATIPTTEIPAAEIAAGLTVADAFIRAELAKSRGEVRRLAQQGGLSVDDERIADVDVPFREVMAGRGALLLRAGKKRFRRVVSS